MSQSDYAHFTVGDSEPSLEVAEHPRYRGPVIDVHVHYDAVSRPYAPLVREVAGLLGAIQLVDTWPAMPYAHQLDAWRALEPQLVRCHVPDFSAGVGSRDFERDALARLRADVEAGCVGVKVWKNLGLHERDVDGARLTIDDPRLAPLWDEIAALDLPVLIHIGDPPCFWDPLDQRNPRCDELRAHPTFWYGGGDFPTLEQLHEQFARLLQRHRATTFIGAHWACFVEDPAEWFRAHPNFFADTAAAVSEMGKGDVSAVRQTLLDHPDRVLFGTDLARIAMFEYPDYGMERRWDLREYFELHWRFFETAETGMPHPIPEQTGGTVSGLDLPDDVLAALYFENVVRLYPRLPAALVERAHTFEAGSGSVV